jgi:hypothetical protein
MRGNIMNVEVNGRLVTIELDPDQAASLAGVLALVVDRSQRQAMDKLYNRLLDNGIIDAGTAIVEVNEDFDPSDPDNNSEFWVVSY